MNHAWQRSLGTLAGIALALLLAGCEITGTVDVRSETEVVADFTITHAEADCLGLEEFRGLVVRGTPDSSGNQVCRAQGTIDLNAFEDVGLGLSRVGEFLVLDLAVPEQLGYTPLDVTVTFPGQVIEAGGGRAAGNRVTLEPGTGITSAGGTRVVALAHPGPEWWVLGVLAGLVSGAALTLAGFWFWRRRQAQRPSATVPAPPEAQPEGARPADRAPAGAPAVPDQPVQSVPDRFVPEQRSPTSSGDPDYAARFAPPPGHRTGPREPAPTSVAAPVQLPPADAEHLVWAPPEERGPGEPPATNGSGRGPID
ncbi:MAG: hypothetical protein IT193_04495 [Propionibacteriaceae bacterium]|nr:hypothetical protein [Propionibacteriaceae bacterium]